MQFGTGKNKKQIKKLENDIKKLLKQNIIVIFFLGLFMGFAISEYLGNIKIKNMVYWNQKKIDKIIIMLENK